METEIRKKSNLIQSCSRLDFVYITYFHLKCHYKVKMAPNNFLKTRT